MTKLIRNLLIIIVVFSNVSLAFGDRLAHLRTNKKIITVADISAPYFTIQMVALKLPPGEPAFFRDVDKVYEFVCADGFVRYTVGRFNTKDEATQQISKYEALGYKDLFVVDTRHLKLTRTDYQPSSNAIGPLAGVTYTVQLAAYRFPVYVTDFEGFDKVSEYYMKDRIYRYCVGSFDGSVANVELEKIKKMGFPDAFLVPQEKYEPFRIE